MNTVAHTVNLIRLEAMVGNRVDTLTQSFQHATWLER
jgi:hypothetical protein